MSSTLQFVLLCLLLVGLATVVFYKKKRREDKGIKRNIDIGMTADNNKDPWEESVKRIDTGEKGAPHHHRVIAVRLMAPKGTVYVGYELMQALSSVGLRYGDHHIFHFYQDQTENVLFSLASAVEPGTFALSEIGSLTCPGLTLFMAYSDSNGTSPLDRLTLMLDTARQLSEDLGGQLLTEKLKPLTEHDVKQWRMQLENDLQQRKMGDLLMATSA